MSARKYVPISTEARSVRDRLLSESDWTQLPDSILSVAQKSSWAAYRQLLRDVPQQSGYPTGVIWPVKPV